MELCTQEEGEHPKAFVECVLPAFQRHAVANPEAPEHRKLFISALVGNLPDRQWQILKSVVGWAGQSLSVITKTFLNSLKRASRKTGGKRN